jgi:hypothetical protein
MGRLDNYNKLVELMNMQWAAIEQLTGHLGQAAMDANRPDMAEKAYHIAGAIESLVNVYDNLDKASDEESKAAIEDLKREK